MQVLLDNLPALLRGFRETLYLSAISAVFALVLGTLLAAMRVSPIPTLRAAGAALRPNPADRPGVLGPRAGGPGRPGAIGRTGRRPRPDRDDPSGVRPGPRWSTWARRATGRTRRAAARQDQARRPTSARRGRADAGRNLRP